MDLSAEFAANDDIHDDEVLWNTDEGPLSDMHLSNAINLDQYKEILRAGSAEYRINIPRWLREETQERITTYQGQNFKVRVGMLPVSIALTRSGGSLGHIGVSSYKAICKMVGDGLRTRGYKIPIAKHDVTMELPHVMVYDDWIKAFDRILEIVCTRAEFLRGGDRSYYHAVELGSKGVRSCLRVRGTIYEFVITKDCSSVADHQNKVLYIGDFNCILLLLDTLGQRICLHLSNEVALLYGVTGAVKRKVLDNVLQTGDEILGLMGNDGYDIIAMYEALVVGIILKMSTDPVTNNTAFLTNCIKELVEMGNQHGYVGRVMKLVEQWTKQLSGLAYGQLSNLFCLYRCWGHPIVDIYAGMAKVHRIGTEEKQVDLLTGTQILCQFRKTFLINYFAKNHMYPNVEISDEVRDSYVAQRIRDGFVIDPLSSQYSTLDFLGVKIKKIWNVPLTYDLCHLLNDRAVTPNQEELIACLRKRGNTMAGGERRGILRWLKGSSINCREFLQSIEEMGLDPDDCIIGMYEKEREIKIVARMFSLMSENMRYYFVLTEELIANHILPLFPEITMKDPLNVLQKKFWTIGGVGKDSSYNVNINIDFSKWNLNMRHELTAGIFQQMDELFGFTMVIGRTHEIFNRSFIYSSSGKYVPTIVNGELVNDPPMAYRGHLGGFEGLRQKGWTVATVCALLEVAESQNAKIRLMGQGDNQIVRLIMPETRWRQYHKTREEMIHSAKDITDRFVLEMDKIFTRARLPIKLRETWVSTRLFMYGKMMLHDGLVLPQWYKKILRSYALTNEGQVTISGIIGTIATNLAAAAGVSDAPDVMYVIYVILAEWSLRYLVGYHPFTRRSILRVHEEKLDIPGNHGVSIMIRSINIERLVASMILIPTAIGGSVTIPLTGFVMRGFPDHASEGYAWVKMLKSVPSPYQSLMSNWYTFLQNKSIEADMLLQSPWAINHKKPPTPGIQSRSAVRDWLLSGSFDNNQFIKESRVVLKAFDRKQVANALLTDPINPLITGEVFAGYPQSYLDGVLRRLENTRTIKKLVLQSQDTTTIISDMMRHEHNHLLYMAWRGDQIGVTFSTCATNQARMARNVGWGRDITGLTTPHPLELMLGTCCSANHMRCPPSDYVYVRVNGRGNYAPYLGSRIKTKIISEQDIDARKEPLIAIGAKICRQAPWVGMGRNMLEVVTKNIDCVCDTSIYDHFIDTDPRDQMATGSIDHRFNPAGASEGVFINYAPQLGSRVYLSSDNMPTYGRGKTNYTLHFQALYCWLQYAATHQTDIVYLHQHLECSECIVPTTDTIPDLPQPFPYFDNIYTEATVQSIRNALGFIDRRGQLDLMQGQKVCHINKDLDAFSEIQLRRGVTWSIAIQIAFSLTHGVIYDPEDSKIEDLQEYPRIYSYKLHQDLLLKYLCHILIMIVAIEINASPEGIELARIKRALVDKMLKLPLTRFKGLASIYIGRNVQHDADRHLFATGSYPETVTSILKAAKNSIIEYMNYVGTVYLERLGSIPIPVNALNNRQFRFLLMFRCGAEYRCGHYMREFRLTQDDDTSHPECTHGHTKVVLVRTPVVRASMDRVVKGFNAIHIVYETPIPEWSRMYVQRVPVSSKSGTQSSCMIGGRAPAEQYYRHHGRSITLPTSSLYKWSSVMSNVVLNRHIIVLGDGTGGTSLVAHTLFPASDVYPCSHFDTSQIIPQDLMGLMPEMSRGYKRISSKVLLSIPDDITDQNWARHLSAEIYLMGIQNVSIVCDIEKMNSIEVCNRLTALPIGTHIILKAYAQDIFERHREMIQMSDITLMFSQHANIKNREVFLEFRVSKDESPNPESLISAIHQLYGQQVTITPLDLSLEERLIEATFSKEVKTSRSLALSHLNNLRFGITDSVLRLKGQEMWAYALDFLNKHYKPPGAYRLHATRTLTPQAEQEIGRALLVVLALVVNMDYVNTHRWSIINLTKKGYRDLLLLPDKSETVIELRRKDFQAYECLRYMREHELLIEQLSPPEDVTKGWICKIPRGTSYARALSVYSSEDYIEVDERSQGT